MFSFSKTVFLIKDKELLCPTIYQEQGKERMGSCFPERYLREVKLKDARPRFELGPLIQFFYDNTRYTKRLRNHI